MPLVFLVQRCFDQPPGTLQFGIEWLKGKMQKAKRRWRGGREGRGRSVSNDFYLLA